jgi:hypothetical protein
LPDGVAELVNVMLLAVPLHIVGVKEAVELVIEGVGFTV